MTDQAIPTGTLFAGKYAITRLVGRGAMSSVYEALHVEVGKRVAIKVIEREYARNEEICARFRQEASAAGRIESEHIVQVFDVGTDPTYGLFMIMEFLVGEDLGARLDREKKLSPALAVHVAVQAARGLAKAHAAGVIHRDLKPTNVFLVSREDGTVLVKLVDFGISKLLTRQGKGQRALTRVGTTVGTPQYMSPEQVRGHPVDERTDVWALGAVLFEMLAGAPVFAHDLTHEQTVLAVAAGTPPQLREVAPWVPAELADVVSRAMNPSLDARIRDCNELGVLLAGAMPGAVRPRREVSLSMDVPPGTERPLLYEPLETTGERMARARMAEAAAEAPSTPATPPPARKTPERRLPERRRRGGVLRFFGLMTLFTGVGVGAFFLFRMLLVQGGQLATDQGPEEDPSELGTEPSNQADAAVRPRTTPSTSKSVRPRPSTPAPTASVPPAPTPRPSRPEGTKKGP